ncbi:hypothetical protein SISNIDRAFT_477815 [Sistotremastrum niveocremeum HHB9708]|uniref:Copper acquisition factor BIM1-like domain-containing protein n=1 Tax=Sistotremastrum niveocremeum HHB9708 TaxID=1314777 RepID=A0A164XFH1_9AGAM|nr:hypothetical protein SISNIDRAFT_477815 [Sistotremastrum niveocremeum HHB9708]
MKFTSGLIAASFLASAAQAHFTLQYPQTRGFDDDAEVTPICGGFNNVTNRTEFPLGPAQIQISSFHTTATVLIEVAVGIDNPTTFSQFNTTSSGTTYPPLVGFNQIPEGPACYNVDISSLNISGATNGTDATILIIYDGGDGTLYQCADVTLVQGFTVPKGAIESNITCANIASAPSTTSSSSSSTSAPTASGKSASGSDMMTSLNSEYLNSEIKTRTF